MKIVIAFNLYYYGTSELNCAYAFFVEPLVRMGHEVQILDFGTLNRTGTSLLVARTLQRFVYSYQPDLLFTVPCKGEIPKWALRIITRFTNTKTLAWNSDDDRRWEDYSRHYANVYDFMVTTYPDIYDRAKQQGYSNVLLSQWAANTHLSKPAPEVEKIYDVCFVGAAYGDRPAYIQALKDAGLTVYVAGLNWDKHIPGTLGALSESDMYKIHQQAKMIVVFSKGYEGGSQIKGRVFEGPAYKTCTLIEQAPGLEQYFVSDKEIVVFSDVQDLLQKVRYYLEHESEREDIARRGYERVLKDHTYDKRLYDAFNEVQKKEKNVSRVGWVVGVIFYSLMYWYLKNIFSIKHMVKRYLRSDSSCKV